MRGVARRSVRPWRGAGHFRLTTMYAAPLRLGDLPSLNKAGEPPSYKEVRDGGEGREDETDFPINGSNRPMNAYQAAQHYAAALRNFADDHGYNPDAVSVHREDSLDGRYGRCPKVIWETGTFRLMGREIDTGYGFTDLTKHGLDPDVAREFLFEPYNAAVVCVHEA